MGLFSSIGHVASSALAAATSYKIAKENRNWQERMSNTAHQREVKDLREAGLNPILSATGGSGATTPTANTTADVSAIGDAVSTAFQMRQDKKRLENETEVAETQKDLNREQANKSRYEADVAHANSAYATEQTRQLMEYGPQQAKANIELTKAQAQATRTNTALGVKSTNANIKNTDANTAKSVKETSMVGKQRQYGASLGVLGNFGIYANRK